MRSTGGKPNWRDTRPTLPNLYPCPSSFQFSPGSAAQNSDNLSGSFARLLDRVILAIEYLEDAVEPRDFEQSLHPPRGIENGHMTLLVSNRSPDRNELSEARAIDVVHGSEIQDKNDACFHSKECSSDRAMADRGSTSGPPGRESRHPRKFAA